MKRIVTGLLASAISLSFIAADVVAANAASTYIAPVTSPAASYVQQVDHTPWHRREMRRDMRRLDRQEIRRDHNNRAYWRGHRGYRDYRPGYRRHGDFWFPLAAFATGMIISGAIADNPPVRVRRSGDAHVNWCYNRYRSYRAYDNTYQPYNGPRRQCYSPYN